MCAVLTYDYGPVQSCMLGIEDPGVFNTELKHLNHIFNMAELQNLNSKIQEAKFQPSDSNLQISTGDDMSQKY